MRIKKKTGVCKPVLPDVRRPTKGSPNYSGGWYLRHMCRIKQRQPLYFTHAGAQTRIPSHKLVALRRRNVQLFAMRTTRTKKARTVGPESSPNRLAMLDGRTREAALVRKTRAELLAHIKNPTVVQRALVERAAWLTLRLNLMEARLAGGEEMSDHASRQYVALSNALRRVLDAIGIQAAKTPPPTIAEIMSRPAPRACEAA